MLDKVVKWLSTTLWIIFAVVMLKFCGWKAVGLYWLGSVFFATVCTLVMKEEINDE
jgi:hypothetical protein